MKNVIIQFCTGRRDKSDMGAVVCIDVSQQETPRGAASFQRSWYSNSFIFQDIECDDFFCLATEKKPVNARNANASADTAFAEGLYDSNTRAVDSRRKNVDSKIKKEHCCFSSKVHPTGSFICVSNSKQNKSQNLNIDSPCSGSLENIPERARIRLKYLKPLPLKSDCTSNQVEQAESSVPIQPN